MDKTWVLTEQEWGQSSKDGPVKVLVVERGSDGCADSEGPTLRSREAAEAFVADVRKAAADLWGLPCLRLTRDDTGRIPPPGSLPKLPQSVFNMERTIRRRGPLGRLRGLRSKVYLPRREP